MLFDKKYDLSLNIDYVKTWSMVNGVRELLQNAIDSDSPFEYQFGIGCLRIISKYAKLEPKSLLLGSTTKSENKDTIGKFGEGYKIAMLVLTRLNYRVTLYNNDVIWQPVFAHSKLYDSKILRVLETKAPEPTEGLLVEIAGLDDNDIKDIKESCLMMQKIVGEIIETDYGDILLDKPGELYVGGLKICQTELKYGYNIKPSHITLERDRQTVSSFNLNYVTSRMWSLSGRVDKVVELIEAETPDIEYVKYSAPEIVKETCYKMFKEKHPGAIAVTSKAELDALVKKGMTNVVMVGKYFGEVVQGSYSYRESVKTQLAVKKPVEVLTEFFEANKQYMRRLAIVHFKQLINQANNWKNE